MTVILNILLLRKVSVLYSWNKLTQEVWNTATTEKEGKDRTEKHRGRGNIQQQEPVHRISEQNKIRLLKIPWAFRSHPS